MPFQYAFNVTGSNSNVPVFGTFAMSGTVYNDGDLLKLDTTTGLAGTVSAGDPGTVLGVFAGTIRGGASGQLGTIYFITPDQIWKCSTNAATYSVNLGAGSVQVLNAGTINSTPGTTDLCILFKKDTLDGNGNVIAYVRFPNTAF